MKKTVMLLRMITNGIKACYNAAHAIDTGCSAAPSSDAVSYAQQQHAAMQVVACCTQCRKLKSNSLIHVPAAAHATPIRHARASHDSNHEAWRMATRLPKCEAAL